MNSKDTPLHTVLFGMFPNAMKALARHSKFGSDKHNPGEPLHWAFDKSTAHAECLCSHLAQAGTIDPETGESHTVAAFWRAAALLETELVRGGAKPGFAVKFAEASAERWVVKQGHGLLRSKKCPLEYPSSLDAWEAINNHGDPDVQYFVEQLP